MKPHEIYLYGMVTKTNGFLLRGDFPKADHRSVEANQWKFGGIKCQAKPKKNLPVH